MFGHVQSHIKKIKEEIAALQSMNPASDVVSAEQSKQWELEELLHREELLWRDKAKAKWMNEGDANTHFFHITTLIHRRRNAIHQLQNSTSNWLTSWAAIGEEFRCFYCNLFTSTQSAFSVDFEGLFQPCLTAAQTRDLHCIPTGQDIQSAFFSMGGHKSPGPDGMTVTFFKQYWGIVGSVVITSIQFVFQTCLMPASFNHTFLTLIPKAAHVSRVDHFRPIALCNVVYKAITKILAGRIRGLLMDLIHPSQAAFVPHRCIGDNVILNHEIMQYFHSKQGKRGYMAIKIDLAKAYDRVEWDVLLHVMSLLGFGDSFCNLVRLCVSTSKFSLLINGSPYGFFTAQRGLRQGDPMSPALFTFIAEILSQLLHRAELAGHISGVKVSRTSPWISHLLYADDLIIYCKATRGEAACVARCLQTFCEWTDQVVSLHKSSIHFSRNVGQHVRSDLCRQLGMSECDHKGLYLGLPYCNFKSKTAAFREVEERLA